MVTSSSVSIKKDVAETDSGLEIQDMNELVEENTRLKLQTAELESELFKLKQRVNKQDVLLLDDLKKIRDYKKTCNLLEERTSKFDLRLKDLCRAKERFEKTFAEQKEKDRKQESNNLEFVENVENENQNDIEEHSSKVVSVEKQVATLITEVNVMKKMMEEQAMQQQAREIAQDTIIKTMCSSYEDETKKYCVKIEDLYKRINDYEDERNTHAESACQQKQEMEYLLQKVEEIQQAYEKNVTQNRKLRETIGELQKENKDSQVKYKEERTAKINNGASFRFKMNEMEENYERLEKMNIALEREVGKLELQYKSGEKKITNLEAQINILDERVEEKDLLIEQLLRDKYKKRGIRKFASCF